jgi:ABC-type dipeptide/oligopeptide/nickel transport system permease subunit
MAKLPIDGPARKAGRTSTDEDFRRAVALQVYLPLGLGVVVVALAVGLGLAAGGAGGLSASGMADVSTVFLLLPLMLLGLIALVGFAAVAVGVERLVRWLPPRSRRAQRLAARFAHKAGDVADKSAQAIVVPKALASVARSVWDSLRPRR